MTIKVVVVGSYNQDFVFSVGDFPQAGETLNSTTMQQGHGGKGSNQAVAARRLGADVSLVACVGNDVFGRLALDFWKAEGINTDFVRVDDTRPTGTASIMVNNAGDNMITLSSGANGNLTVEDVQKAFDAIESADVLLVQLEIPFKVAEAALRLAKRKKMLTILNPTPVIDDVMDLTVYADVVTPNEFELEQIYGSIDELLYGDSAEYLLTSEAQIVVVTLADQGARWIKRDGTMGVAPYAVQVIDSIGAGDAFTAALGVALAEGKDLSAAVKFANAASAVSVQRHHAAASMPTREDVERLLIQFGEQP